MAKYIEQGDCGRSADENRLLETVRRELAEFDDDRERGGAKCWFA